MPKAYYNEFDPYAAQWLRNLIVAGHIAPGDVDSRSIEDVRPSDLSGYTQCHFFAGIGVWSYALRRAGWPDSRPVWTGSCPCQPFSAAGKGNGFADERHLWPAWLHLIGQRSPVVVFGEQVSSKDADVWVDLVQTDMEALGYAFGAVPFPSAGVGAPHIRDRLYWLADSKCTNVIKRAENVGNAELTRGSLVSGLADSESDRHQRAGKFSESTGGHGIAHGGATGRLEYTTGDGREQRGTESRWGSVATGRTLSGLADSDSNRYATNVPGSAREAAAISGVNWPTKPSAGESGGTSETICDSRPTGPTNGFWRNADWLLCRDGKWRPVEPGTFPLANGAPSRVGRLRAYGNAINAEAAIAFIQSYMECRP